MKFENEIAYFASGQYEQLREHLNEDGKINCDKFLQDFQSALDENPYEFAEAALKNISNNCPSSSYGKGIKSGNPDYNKTLIECAKKIFMKYPEILFFKNEKEDKSIECLQNLGDGLNAIFFLIEKEKKLQKEIKEKLQTEIEERLKKEIEEKLQTEIERRLQKEIEESPDFLTIREKIVSLVYIQNEQSLVRMKYNFTISIIDAYLCEVEKLDTIDENTILRLLSLTYTRSEEKTPEHQELIDRIKRINPNKIKYKYNLSEKDLEKKLEEYRLNDLVDSSEKLKNVFDSFPKYEEWRLFVDMLQQKEGWKEYEKREPGSINAMSKAWDHIKQTIGQELTLEYIKKIHEIASSHHGKNLPGILSGGARFGISVENMTIKGFSELTKNERFFYYYKQCQPNLKWSPLEEDKIKEEMQAKIDAYNVGLKNASTSKEKITLILELFRGMEHLHPFQDCNCRTFFTLLLNRELIKIGFPFAIFDDPNRLDGFDTLACIEEIRKGFNNFKNVKEQVLEKGFKTTEELLALEDELPITEQPSSGGSWVVSYISTLRSRCSLM